MPARHPDDPDLTEALAPLRANPDAAPAELPPGTLAALVRALSAPDPGLRDDLAASTLVRWIAMDRLLSDEALSDLHRQATATATDATDATATDAASAADGPLATLGDRDTDTVFGRSFTLLLLALLHAADNSAAYLDDGQYRDSLAVQPLHAI
ncbi:MAG TPA: DUF2785 domain-containing protein [Streptosporangiaceae bacterium]|jgi:hypothetical protein